MHKQVIPKHIRQLALLQVLEHEIVPLLRRVHLVPVTLNHILVAHILLPAVSDNRQLHSPPLKRTIRSHRVLQNVPQPVRRRVLPASIVDRVLVQEHLRRHPLLCRVPVRERAVREHRCVLDALLLQLRRQSQLVRVPVPNDKLHTVRVLLLERQQQLGEADVPRPLVLRIPTKHKHSILLLESELAFRHIILPPQDLRQVHVALKIVQIPLHVCQVPTHHDR